VLVVECVVLVEVLVDVVVGLLVLVELLVVLVVAPGSVVLVVEWVVLVELLVLVVVGLVVVVGLLVLVVDVVCWTSTAPMSQAGPLGRGRARWSVAGHPPPVAMSIAGLPIAGTCVGV
jgi:hypothetical protein